MSEQKDEFPSMPGLRMVPVYRAEARPMARVLRYHAGHMIEHPNMRDIRMQAFFADERNFVWCMHIRYHAAPSSTEALHSRREAHAALGRRVAGLSGCSFEGTTWGEDASHGTIYWLERDVPCMHPSP